MPAIEEITIAFPPPVSAILGRTIFESQRLDFTLLFIILSKASSVILASGP